MARGGDVGPAFAAGIFAGFVVGTIVFGIGLTQLVKSDTKDEQFKKDCESMAHGTIDKSASTICVKNGKILFHQ